MLNFTAADRRRSQSKLKIKSLSPSAAVGGGEIKSGDFF